MNIIYCLRIIQRWYISCECNNKKSEQKLKYKNQFSLYEIQKVKWFLAYDTLDECLSEIFQILNEKKGIIKEENDNQINLIIPLNSKKFSEILFPLYKKEISDKEKIDELYEIINSLNEKNNEQRKQIINLKEKLYNINDQEIRIYGGKNEKLNGISIDLSLFGKEDIFFENYYKEFLNIKGNFKTELEFKDIYESKKLKDLLPKLLNFNLIFKGLTINNKLIIKDFIKEIIDLEKENIIKENSEKISKDNLEKEKIEEYNSEKNKIEKDNFLEKNKAEKDNFDKIENDNLEENKIVDFIFEEELLKKNKSQKGEIDKNNLNKPIRNTFLLNFLKYLNLCLSFKKSHLNINELNFDPFIDLQKILNKNSDDIINIIQNIIYNKFTTRDKDELLFFENLDFKDISISFLFGLISFGANLNIKSKTLDEEKNKLILSRREDIKRKEILLKEMLKQNEILLKEMFNFKNNEIIMNEEINEQEINNSLNIIKDFRKEFELSEYDYPNKRIYLALKVNNFNKSETFSY